MLAEKLLLGLIYVEVAVLISVKVQYTAAVEQLQLDPCRDGVFEVVDNSLHNTITCVNTLARPPLGHLTWKWTLSTQSRKTFDMADCQLYGGACRSYVPFAGVVQSPEHNASELSISTLLQRYDTTQGTFFNGAALFANATISCRDPFYLGGQQKPLAECTTDFVRPVENASCSARFNTNTSQWTVLVHCDVTAMFSAMGRYTCRLISLLGDEASALGSVTKMRTTPIQRGRYVRGSCDITSSLPSTNGEHRYFVEITPGWKKFEAQFTGSRLIRKPSEVTLTHNCPQRVAKGELVDCTCNASDAGTPPGKLLWASDHSAQTQPAERDGDWRQLQCSLVWNGTTVKSLSLGVQVLRKPTSLPTHNCPEYVKKGSDVTCDCVTKDPGNPPAELTWDKTNSSVLVVSDVKRDVIWKTFTCRMTWNGTEIGTVKYKVAVIPDNDTLQQHGHYVAPVRQPVVCESWRPAYIRGLATGLGIGLAVVLLFVIVSTLLLWRRGWMLPCSSGLRASKEGDVRETRRPSAANGESRRGSQSGRSPAFSSNVYDRFDRSQMGQRAPYETLQTQPKSAKRNKNQANGQQNAAFIPSDSGARKESVQMTQIQRR